MVAGGDRAAVLETTSHGLAAERVAGIAYDAAILTNLSHEHLEFHGTFEAYRAAKRRLFERLGAGTRRSPTAGRVRPIVNADDPAAELFVAAGRSAGARVLTYGSRAPPTSGRRRSRRMPAACASASPRAVGRGRSRSGSPGGSTPTTRSRRSRSGVGWDLDLEAVRSGLEAVAGVPGRMERIDRGQPFAVIVDYAHSPAALRRCSISWARWRARAAAA